MKKIKSVLEVNNIRLLVNLYHLYFIRKIMNISILKNKWFRLIFIITCLVLFLITTFSIYAFFKNFTNVEESMNLLLKTYSNTIILWNIILMIFLKVIFYKGESFQKFTSVFPVTNAERNTAILIYETIISSVVIFLISSSVTLSIIFLYGTTFIQLMIVNIFYTSVLTYLVLQVLSKSIALVLLKLKLGKIIHIINISTLSIIFAVIFKESIRLVQVLVSDILFSREEFRSVLLILYYIFEKYGFLNVTLIFITIFSVLILLLIIISDSSYIYTGKFIKLLKIKNINIMNAYLASLLRNKENINSLIISYVIVGILLFFNLDKFLLYSLLIITFNGIYVFVHTMKIRIMLYKLEYSAWKDYLFIVAAQFTMNFILTIPILFISMYLNGITIHLLVPYIICLFASFLVVLAGILFPPYEDNPFSVLTSIIVMTIPLILVGSFVIFLKLSFTLTIFSVLLFYATVIYFSVKSMKKLKGIYINEINN